MNLEPREKTLSTLGSLLDRGQYQEFLERTADADEETVAEVVCSFASRTIERLPELGYLETRNIIEDFRERVVKVHPSPWLVKNEFNKTIRGFIEQTNAARYNQEIADHSHGTRLITREELICELNRILKLSPRKARAAYRELVGSIAVYSLPIGVCAGIQNALAEFSMDRLESLARMISRSLPFDQCRSF